MLSQRIADVELLAPPTPTGGLLLRGSSSMPISIEEL